MGRNEEEGTLMSDTHRFDREADVSQQDIDRLRYNRQRMKVLKGLLRLAGVGREVDFNDLWELCARMGAAMVPDQLDFHLRFMEEWNWVELRRATTPRKVDEIVGVTLTGAGVDRIDIGRMPTPEETQGLRDRKK
jgi:hypothetical protein